MSNLYGDFTRTIVPVEEVKKEENKCEILVCEVCGSTDIEKRAWVNANTNEYIDDSGEYSDQFCNNCEGNTYFTTLNDWESMKEEEKEAEDEQ